MTVTTSKIDINRISDMIGHLKILTRHRELLWMWTQRNIMVRYKQSFLGAAWAILQPLSLMVMFTFIFTIVLQVPSNDVPYPVFSYSGLLPWTFLAASITFAVPSLVQNMNLVTKIYFPREIFPISAVLASLVDLLLASIVFMAMLLFYEIRLSITMLLVPGLLMIQVLLTLGIVFFASAANVFYRDLRFVVPLGVQLWMYATPVIYPVSLIPERFRPLYMLNPMAGLITSYRAVTLHGIWPDWGYLGIATGISVAIFLTGYLYFKRVEWRFADVI